MMRYVIGSLGVIILVLLSIIYKNEMSPQNRFPILETPQDGNEEIHLYLYLFFSKANCSNCLQEIVDVLNNLPPQFVVFGIVPEDDLSNEMDVRLLTGAVFPLLSAKRFKKHSPWYVPTIVGVSPSEKILFILPGISGENIYLEKFLYSLYSRFQPILSREKHAESLP